MILEGMPNLKVIDKSECAGLFPVRARRALAQEHGLHASFTHISLSWLGFLAFFLPSFVGFALLDLGSSR